MNDEIKKGRKKTKPSDISERYSAVFASRLRELIKEKGITQQELSDGLGGIISRQTINKWTLGTTSPDIISAAAIADYFGVSTDYLLGRSKCSSTDEELKKVSDYLGLSDAAVMEILKSSGKITEAEWYRWLSQMYEKGKNTNKIILPNGYNSSLSDICDWIILNLLFEADFTVRILLSDMYKMEKYKEIEEDGFNNFSDKSYIVLNRLADRCKYIIDKLLVECSKSAKNFSYYSIYDRDMTNVTINEINKLN